jgi:hypothetical protein
MGGRKQKMDPIEKVAKSIDYGTPVNRKKKQTTIHANSSYIQKPVNLQKTPLLFFPPGKEMLFLGIYFAILPYITGLLFLFFYVSEGKPAVLGSIVVSTDANFFLIWSIGYEILAAIILLWIIKNAVIFSIRNSNEKKSGRASKLRRP